MSGLELEDYGSGADDDLIESAGDDAISLWLVFGLCIAFALGTAILFQCRRSGSDELNEGLVAVRITRDNDDAREDEDDAVFGRLDSRV